MDKLKRRFRIGDYIKLIVSDPYEFTEYKHTNIIYDRITNVYKENNKFHVETEFFKYIVTIDKDYNLYFNNYSVINTRGDKIDIRIEKSNLREYLKGVLC